MQRKWNINMCNLKKGEGGEGHQEKFWELNIVEKVKYDWWNGDI